jgi:hypothetical protein
MGFNVQVSRGILSLVSTQMTVLPLVLSWLIRAFEYPSKHMDFVTHHCISDQTLAISRPVSLSV